MANTAVDPPEVSVIVCTRDRPALLTRALASVHRARQLVPEVAVEILVVADGDESITGSMVPEQPHRLVAGPKAGVGAARAVGLAAARGELIAYCDDDDEWTPDHLRLLVDELLAHPNVALVHGDAEWRDVGVPASTGALAAGPLVPGPDFGAASRVHASDVLHRAAAARDVGGFDPSLHAYEDLDLWLRMDEAHRRRYVPVIVAAHDRHSGCVTAVDHRSERERLLRFHQQSRPWRAAATSRRPAPPFDPATWQPPRRQLLWQSPLNSLQSFGLVGRQLLLAATRAGIDATLASPPPADDPDLRRFAVSAASSGRIGFSYDYWHRAHPLAVDLLVIATMREGTLVPKARVNAINQTAALLYVPCRQNLESFQACGVRIPVKVLPYGVDPARFPYLERTRTGTEPFTVGTFGALSPRKGTDVLVRAFREEFAPGEPVRLLLKTVDDLPFVTDDPRVRVITGFWTHSDLLGLLRRLDAFVLPSRAEGFGLCGLEAMATGLPTIATAWSGPADYLNEADSFPLCYRMVDAAATEANGVRYFGEWAEPDLGHLRSLLRWLYEHPREAARMGRSASARIHREWTWDRVATALRDDLDLLARGVSPASSGVQPAQSG